MKTSTGKNFWGSWTLIILLSLVAYIMGGLLFGRYVCAGLYDIHSLSGCYHEMPWGLAVWPIMFIFRMLFNTVGLIIYSMVISSAVWYFFWHDKKSKVNREA